MYLRSFTNRHPEPSFILHWRCDFSSYKRNAVVMTMQKAKVSLARQRHSTARDNRLGNPLANRLTLPLLEIETRWLFQQLARELAC
jgi:hypothetical protein